LKINNSDSHLSEFVEEASDVARINCDTGREKAKLIIGGGAQGRHVGDGFGVTKRPRGQTPSNALHKRNDWRFGKEPELKKIRRVFPIRSCTCTALLIHHLEMYNFDSCCQSELLQDSFVSLRDFQFSHRQYEPKKLRKYLFIEKKFNITVHCFPFICSVPDIY
jgi:hypothetical protein